MMLAGAGDGKGLAGPSQVSMLRDGFTGLGKDEWEM